MASSSSTPPGASGSSTGAAGQIIRPVLKIPGLIGPTSHPDSHGFKPGDSHLIVNDDAETVTGWSYHGERLWVLPALARGQGSDREWNRQNTDTPPGLYRSGTIYRDWTGDPQPPCSRDRLAYGWVSIDLVELEGQEQRVGRAGIMAHGGGSGLGWPRAWAADQPLLPTLGCIRMRNGDLQRLILPLHDRGAVFWSVYQEA
jgi:hypothetical protein